MKKLYTFITLFIVAAVPAISQQVISFEESEGFELGNISGQNNWEVTEGNNGFIQNQIISDELVSHGEWAFKNTHESDFDEQWLPIFGAVKVFDTPYPYQNFTISYDVLVTNTMGSDFEFVIYSVNENDEFVPVAGSGVEYTGGFYFINNDFYGSVASTKEWEPNTWINIRIEVGEEDINYYINGELDTTVPTFTKSPVYGFNILHNNYGNDGYYDNIAISPSPTSIDNFSHADIKIFPNPISDNLYITGGDNLEFKHAVVYSVSGQKLIEIQNASKLELNNLLPGTYLLKANLNNGIRISRKITKK